MNGMFQTAAGYFLNYEFFVIFVVLCLASFFAAAYSKNKKIKLAFTAVFSVFAALAVLESALSFVSDKPGTPHRFGVNSDNTQKKRVIREVLARAGGQNFYLEDSAIKEFMSAHTGEAEIVYDINYTIYSNNGVRYTRGGENSQNAYVFLGCSFVFGSSVGDEQTLPYYFSKLTGFKNNVLNLGYPGHATNSALSILNSDFIKKHTGKSKINRFFYLVMQDQIKRNFRMPGDEPSDAWLYDGNKWIFAGAGQPFGKIKSAFRRSYLFKKIFSGFIESRNEDFYENYLAESLREMNEIVGEKYGSELTVVVWNDYRIKGLIEKLGGKNLDCVILPDRFNGKEYNVPYDFHPNAKAYEEAANILYNHIKEKPEKRQNGLE